jgi:hypothetical protein
MMLEEIQRCNYSQRTAEAHLRAMEGFAKHFQLQVGITGRSIAPRSNSPRTISANTSAPVSRA